jgi:hypothetical protein
VLIIVHKRKRIEGLKLQTEFGIWILILIRWDQSSLMGSIGGRVMLGSIEFDGSSIFARFRDIED